MLNVPRYTRPKLNGSSEMEEGTLLLPVAYKRVSNMSKCQNRVSAD